MTEQTDVLVVGAGPSGLALAGELHRRGVATRIVDRNAAPTTQSRAIGVHARTLEIFDDLGIADDLVARGIRCTGATMMAAGKPIVEIDFAGLDTRFPFVLCVSQVETETVLRDLLERRGGRVERETELVSLVQHDDHVEAVLRGPRGEERAQPRWVVGCDGAHSAVRHALGASFGGHTYEDTFVLADAHLDWDVPATRITTFLAHDGVAAFFPLGGTRWRVVVSAAAALGDQPTLADVRALCEQRAGRPVPISDAGWIAPFRIHCRQVTAYRDRRVFLAGDAAHIHSPVGGQGMNTGIQDVHNLAWKLALVTRGAAGPALLDSYQAERHAIGQRVLARTDLATKLGTFTGALAPLRDHFLHFVTSFEPVRRRIVRDASQITVAYENSPIVGEATRSLLVARIGSDAAAESPTIAAHRAFASGPQPGARARDAEVLRDGEPVRLARLISGDAFTLLLFDGRSHTAEGYATLAAIARRITARFGPLVQPYVVTPRADRPAELPPDLPVLHGDLDASWGARSECLYLVRPDLYVGFRSQPADGDALEAHLAKILT
jgi:2-polyprenyl-6-methoxyphenol hydroxylase-like FAD-dependent oxidoreductase